MPLAAKLLQIGEVTTEGFVGLVTGFVEAGANTVVATRWPIDDGQSQTMMVHIHRLLARRRWGILLPLDVGAALRNTVRRAEACGYARKTTRAFIVFGDPMLRL